MGPGFESLKVHQTVGVFSVEGPPVPIPNTEVKLYSGDNTCLATDREDSSLPTQANPFGKARGYGFTVTPLKNFTRKSVIIGTKVSSLAHVGC